jgi:hypothetical protein
VVNRASYQLKSEAVGELIASLNAALNGESLLNPQ